MFYRTVHVTLVNNWTIKKLCIITQPINKHSPMIIIQGDPLATEPGISLIIETPMKILQQNLNRSMFISPLHF